MGGSPLKIEGLLGMLTIRLQDDNFAKWSFQFRSVLEGCDLFDYFDGTNVCPPKYVVSLESGVTSEITAAYREWIKADKALLSLLIATLGDEAIEYITQLTDIYATVSRARINYKIELHTIKKGTDSIEKYLLRLKRLKDQLLAAGESISDNDLIVAALAGLPSDAERTAKEYNSFLQFPMTGMLSQGESSVMGASRHYYQGDNSNGGGSNSSHFYQGKSSATGASRQSTNGFNGSSGSNKGGSTWGNWNGNNGQGNKDNS
ncbi:S2-RNase [Pyrus ussuriensis x Pyrus communis]|uniref:S2-RNase n=1 Tax=Pyrus ussuriensis x Pyrus communis TaxID=2448454 RepID=A0A5N5GHG0_9ROSA|nr:S2-RNase [Pyrus ussuriensis x Pyrus communis]